MVKLGLTVKLQNPTVKVTAFQCPFLRQIVVHAKMSALLQRTSRNFKLKFWHSDTFIS